MGIPLVTVWPFIYFLIDFWQFIFNVKLNDVDELVEARTILSELWSLILAE